MGSSQGPSPKHKHPHSNEFCLGCQTEHPIELFPLGSSSCSPSKQAIQNLGNAAKLQGQTKLWQDCLSNPKKLKKVVARYKRVHGKKAGSKRSTPQILDLVNEHRQEQQLLRDGLLEMMNERQYTHWMAKPKNGSIDAILSKT